MATLIDLPREDIVYRVIFTYLSMRDLLNLRFATKSFKPLVDGYFGTLKYLYWYDLPPTLLMILSKTTRNLSDIDLPVGMNIDDFILRSFLIGNKNITTISLRACCRITDYGVQPIADLMHLTHLTIRDNGWVTDNFVKRLTELLSSQLTGVDFSNCQVGDTSLVGFFAKFKGLTSVDLEDLPRMSDETLYVIAENTLGLDNISLIGNRQLSEKSIRAVIQSCSKLTKLCIMGCTKVSKDFKNSISRILMYE